VFKIYKFESAFLSIKRVLYHNFTLMLSACIMKYTESEINSPDRKKSLELIFVILKEMFFMANKMKTGIYE